MKTLRKPKCFAPALILLGAMLMVRLAEALTLPAAQPGEFDRWRETISKAAKLNDPELIDQIWRNAIASQDQIAAIVYQIRYTDVAPQKAFDAAISTSRFQQAAQILVDWALVDLESAFDAWFKYKQKLEGISVGSRKGKGYGDIPLPVFARLALAQDDVFATKLLDRLTGDDREDFAYIVLTKIADEDPRQALNLIDEIDSFEYERFFFEIGRSAGVISGENAFAEYQSTTFPKTRWNHDLKKSLHVGILLGWAARNLDAALKKANELELESEVLYELISSNPSGAILWAGKNLKEEGERHTVLHLLSQELDSGQFLFHEVESALSNGGFLRSQKVRKQFSWYPKKTPKSASFPNYQVKDSYFDRVVKLSAFLTKAGIDYYPELWRKSCLPDSMLPSSWSVIETQMLLAAWTKIDPSAALYRPAYYGVDASSGHLDDMQDYRITVDWFNMNPTDVVDRWQKGHLLHHRHYDEGGHFVKINSAAAIAEGWANSDCGAALKWYLSDLWSHGRIVNSADNPGFRFAAELVQTAGEVEPEETLATWRGSLPEGTPLDAAINLLFFYNLGKGWGAFDSAAARKFATDNIDEEIERVNFLKGVKSNEKK